MKNNGVYTTAFGIPVSGDIDSMTAGERGTVLMQDIHFIEKLGHFERESASPSGWCAPGERAHTAISRSPITSRPARAR